MKKLVIAGALLLGLTVTAWAGGAAGKNLEFFPKDISQADLKTEMKVIKASLGTNCAFCHQEKPARDFSVDTEKKKFARDMLVLTKKLTGNVCKPEFFGGKKPPRSGFTCYMCHKGAEKVSLEPEKPDDEARFNAMVDSGRKKRTIDAMKKLVDELDKNYFTWKDAPKATCWMCHRGRGGFRTRLPQDALEGDDDDAPSSTKDDDDGAKPAPRKPDGEKGDKKDEDF